MPYISVQDFFDKTAGLTKISREEELALAAAMAQGDAGARSRLIEGHLPMVAGHLRKCGTHFQTLGHLYSCLQALEKAVGSFNFLQNSESFTHRLSWWLRQATTAYIAEQRNTHP